jgi:hypothetical protein
MAKSIENLLSEILAVCETANVTIARETVYLSSLYINKRFRSGTLEEKLSQALESLKSEKEAYEKRRA